MAKKRVGCQIVNLTPYDEKLGIALISLCAGRVPYIVGKLSTRAITFLETSPQLKVYTQSYGPPKLQKSQFWEFQIPIWESRNKMTFGC